MLNNPKIKRDFFRVLFLVKKNKAADGLMSPKIRNIKEIRNKGIITLFIVY